MWLALVLYDERMSDVMGVSLSKLSCLSDIIDLFRKGAASQNNSRNEE